MPLAHPRGHAILKHMGFNSVNSRFPWSIPLGTSRRKSKYKYSNICVSESNKIDCVVGKSELGYIIHGVHTIFCLPALECTPRSKKASTI
jgi:hypothetical protein